MNAFAPRNPLLLKLETGFIFLLALAIFVSKPLIYLATLLLLATMAARLVIDQPYRKTLFDNRLFRASVIVFLLGIVSTSIGSSHTEDIGWIVKKTLLLILMVPLMMAFENKTNRIIAILGLLVGFWIAFVLTGSMYDWNWNWTGGRYPGATWDVGMWGVVCAMLIVFLTPVTFLTSTKWGFKALIFATILAAVMMLISSGSRGPLVGAVAGVLVYLVIKQVKALIVILIIGFIGNFIANSIWPEQILSFKQRTSSVVNIETDASNYIRLALWENGAALLLSQLKSNEKTFWFGNGHRGKAERANDFFYNEFKEKAKVKPGALEAIHPNVADQHNMYLDSALSNGVLWTLASLLLFVWMALTRTTQGGGLSQAWLAPPMLVCYFVTGITYAILPHFAFMFFVFFATLLRSIESYEVASLDFETVAKP